MTTKKQQAEQAHKTQAIISIILPILGWFVAGLPLSIVGLVLAITARNRTKIESTRTLATIGLVLSIIMLTIMVVSLLIIMDSF